jgi:hypothetical protein
MFHDPWSMGCRWNMDHGSWIISKLNRGILGDVFYLEV